MHKLIFFKNQEEGKTDSLDGRQRRQDGVKLVKFVNS